MFLSLKQVYLQIVTNLHFKNLNLYSIYTNMFLQFTERFTLGATCILYLQYGLCVPVRSAAHVSRSVGGTRAGVPPNSVPKHL